MDPQIIEELKGRLGTVVGGRWKLVKILGLGASAGVYRGVDEEGWRVAVKVMHSKFLRSRIVRERFMREQSILDQVQHRHTLRIYETNETLDGLPYIVMELLEGQTLARIMNKRGEVPLELDRVVAYMLPVLEALQLCHSKDILHRDLKPANIFLTQEGVIKLLDFGVAKYHQDGKNLTRDGATIGTPAFMSPEQASGQMGKLDARSDVFSVGATMHYLLSGQYIHHEETAQMTYLKAATSPAPSLESHAPHIAPEVIALVDRAVAWNPADRWQDAATMAMQIRAVVDALNMKAARQRIETIKGIGLSSASGRLDALDRTTEDQAQVSRYRDEDVRAFWSGLELAIIERAQGDEQSGRRGEVQAFDALKRLFGGQEVACVFEVYPYGLVLEEASEQGALWEPSEPRARESCYMLSSSGVRKMRVLPRIRREDLYALLTLFERSWRGELGQEDDLATAIWSKQVIGVELEMSGVLGDLQGREYQRLDQAFAVQFDALGETIRSEFALEIERMRVLASARQDTEELLEREPFLFEQRVALEPVHRAASSLSEDVSLALQGQHKQQRRTWAGRFGQAMCEVLQAHQGGGALQDRWSRPLGVLLQTLCVGERIEDLLALLQKLLVAIEQAPMLLEQLCPPSTMRQVFVLMGVLPGRPQAELMVLDAAGVSVGERLLEACRHGTGTQGYVLLVLDTLCSSTRPAEQLRPVSARVMTVLSRGHEAQIVEAFCRTSTHPARQALLRQLFVYPDRKPTSLLALYEACTSLQGDLLVEALSAILGQPHRWRQRDLVTSLERLLQSEHAVHRQGAMRLVSDHQMVELAPLLVRRILHRDFHLFSLQERREMLETLRKLSLEHAEKSAIELLHGDASRASQENASTQHVALELLAKYGEGAASLEALKLASQPHPERHRDVQQAAHRALEQFMARRHAAGSGAALRREDR